MVAPRDCLRCRGGARALQGTGGHRGSALEGGAGLQTEHPERTANLSEKEQMGTQG